MFCKVFYIKVPNIINLRGIIITFGGLPLQTSMAKFNVTRYDNKDIE